MWSYIFRKAQLVYGTKFLLQKKKEENVGNKTRNNPSKQFDPRYTRPRCQAGTRSVSWTGRVPCLGGGGGKLE